MAHATTPALGLTNSHSTSRQHPPPACQPASLFPLLLPLFRRYPLLTPPLHPSPSRLLTLTLQLTHLLTTPHTSHFLAPPVCYSNISLARPDQHAAHSSPQSCAALTLHPETSRHGKTCSSQEAKF